MTSWESEVEAAQAEAAEAAEATESLRLIPPSHLRSFKKAKFLTFGVVCWISADLNMES